MATFSGGKDGFHTIPPCFLNVDSFSGETMKKHYTYKLTAINPVDERIEYIGVRSCDCDPDQDSKYMSSSKQIAKAINAGVLFKKVILKEWDTRKEAVAHEVELHNKFDVSTNPKYFNKAKQTSVGFDTSGLVGENNNRYGVPFDDEIKNQISNTMKEKNLKWFTNGVESIRISFGNGELPPNGFYEGRLFDTSHVTDDWRKSISLRQKGMKKSYMLGDNNISKRPEVKEKISIKSSEYHNRPEVKIKKSLAILGNKNPTKRPEIAKIISYKAKERNLLLKQFFELSGFTGNKRTVTVAQATNWLQLKGI
jgi:hypothetical protein